MRLTYENVVEQRERAEGFGQRRCWDIIWLRKTPIDNQGKVHLTVKQVAAFTGVSTRWVYLVEEEYDRRGAASFGRGFTLTLKGRGKNSLGGRGPGRPPKLDDDEVDMLMEALQKEAPPAFRPWNPRNVVGYIQMRFRRLVCDNTARKYLQQARPTWKEDAAAFGDAADRPER